MAATQPQQRRPRCAQNVLHQAAGKDAVEEARLLLASGSIDIDQGDAIGRTPLIIAAIKGHSRVAKVLLDGGAGVSIAVDGGFTALHVAAANGHVAVAACLLKAGAALEVQTELGLTPLHVASCNGHPEMVELLMLPDAANIDVRRHHDGMTPLYAAADQGHTDVVREVLQRWKADPQLTMTEHVSGKIITSVPLDRAAQCGHLGVMRELLRHAGIGGSGGRSRGLDALYIAAQGQQVGAMALLMDAGVIDTRGSVLTAAAGHGGEAPVKFLLRRLPEGQRGAYVNKHRDGLGRTPLLTGIAVCGPGCTRVVRLLVDAGADTASSVRVSDGTGKAFIDDTPLAFAVRSLRRKEVMGEDATEKQMRRLEGTRRLLLRVEAVRAISWLWPSRRVTPRAHEMRATGKEEAGGEAKKVAVPTQLRLMLPVLRCRAAAARGTLFMGLVRYPEKP